MDRASRVVLVLAVFAWIAGCLAASTQAAKPVWRDLFNGQDLTGWQNAAGEKPGDGWVVEDGAMVRKDRAGDIWTKDRFGDFILDLEFKTAGNSGIFIRTDNPRDCVQTGIEVAINKPAAEPGKHSTGAIYDCLAPGKVADKPDAWNHIVITAKDNKITIVMNREKIIDMDLNQWTEANKNPDGTKNKFRTALKDFKRGGHVGLQEHGAVVAYRNIKIQMLPK